MCGRVLDIRVWDKGGSQKLVMACGPVDRRADRAEWARAKKSPHGPARTGRPVRAQPAAGRAFDGGPAGPKKKYKILKLSV